MNFKRSKTREKDKLSRSSFQPSPRRSRSRSRRNLNKHSPKHSFPGESPRSSANASYKPKAVHGGKYRSKKLKNNIINQNLVKLTSPTWSLKTWLNETSLPAQNPHPHPHSSFSPLSPLSFSPPGGFRGNRSRTNSQYSNQSNQSEGSEYSHQSEGSDFHPDENHSNIPFPHNLSGESGYLGEGSENDEEQDDGEVLEGNSNLVYLERKRARQFRRNIRYERCLGLCAARERIQRRQTLVRIWIYIYIYIYT